jgi:hypothetical protein
MRVILYELNEVPWRVVDTFVKKHPKSAFAEVLNHSLQYTTVTKDSGELHPWTTWPSLHRGVYNDDHDIRFINQEIKTPYKPTWEILSDHKIPVGVFGSLQSWPVPKKGSYVFYVPDTFAQTPETHPKSVEPFQIFNLEQTKRDGGVEAKPIEASPQFIQNTLSMLFRGIRIPTLFILIRQLINEKLNKNFRNIRSIFQSPVAFDFFFKLLKGRKPQYATFFTNHAAGMMHRYWKHLFPKDFKYTLKGEDDAFKAQAIIKAMKIADDQIRKLKNYADQDGTTLIIASSMGQDAIDRGEFLGELHITDLKKFVKALDYGGSLKNNLAMSPDYSFSFKKASDLTAFKKAVSSLKDKKGKSIFTFKKSGLTLNINLQTRADLVRNEAFYRGTGKKKEELAFSQLGITVEKRDQGTAYHIPEGMVLFYRKNLVPEKTRKTIQLAYLAPTILSLFDVMLPQYMKKPIKEITQRLR